ncbi:MAG: hypothetical protein R3E36_09895 [Nitrosomonas sp.]|nr:hypothetical protein [Burkholderiales bacterium]MDR4520890.1 hypothetical protein [Nitrosomonas sp.]
MGSGMKSGLYEQIDTHSGIRGELRLDVDGNYPQMAASGTSARIHWVAQKLEFRQLANGVRYSGPIIFKENFQYSKVSIELNNSIARVTFTDPVLPELIQDYAFVSHSFREVQFEYDRETGVNLTLKYQTNSHADRPAALPIELLTIDKVFERSGFHVIRTNADTVVNSGSGSDGTWSNQELHDAMLHNFSKITQATKDQAQWALWTFFAKKHDDSDYGGVMFDDFAINNGNNKAQRQGTALFVESNSFTSPAGDATPDAWIQREIFFTAVHEMGHAFNLAHAWRKAKGRPWIDTLVKNYGLESFMNYPTLYKSDNGLSPTNPGGNRIEFFKKFMFRFSDEELLFLRHAPERFVQMGNADFNVNHAFEQVRVSPAPVFALELRTHRAGNEFEFLEPIMIELKLTNQSEQPQLVNEHLLSLSDHITVTVQRRGGSPVLYRPFVRVLHKDNVHVLEPKKAMYAPLFISVDKNGWLIEASGWYEVRVCLHMDEEDIVSAPLRIRVAPPLNWDEEYLAQDFFCDEVGRTLTLDGSYYLTQANDVLTEVADRLKERRVSIHAKVALSIPKTKNYKIFSKTTKGRTIREMPVDEKAVERLAEMLGSTLDCTNLAANTLGHIDYNYYVKIVASALNKMEKTDLSQQIIKNMYSAFKKRNVADNVLMEIHKSIKKAKKNNN